MPQLFQLLRTSTAEVDAWELTFDQWRGLFGWLSGLIDALSVVTGTASLIDIVSAPSTTAGVVEIVSTSTIGVVSASTNTSGLVVIVSTSTGQQRGEVPQTTRVRKRQERVDTTTALRDTRLKKCCSGSRLLPAAVQRSRDTQPTWATWKMPPCQPASTETELGDTGRDVPFLLIDVQPTPARFQPAKACRHL